MSRLERWSRRKLREDTELADASEIDTVNDDTADAESGDRRETVPDDGEADDVVDTACEPPAPGSLDATLPDPESLAPGSDIKAFLEPGVSSGLRRRALRRLFAGDKYGIRDGLDDYDHDYREKLKPLASELAQRMRKWTAPAEEPVEAPDEEEVAADQADSGEAHPSPTHPEQDTEQHQVSSSDDSEDAIESHPPDDDTILDQGRVGSSYQSGQD